MCGRMAITLPHDAMAQLFEAAPANDLPPVPNYNLCPTMPIAVCTSDAGLRHLRPMRWGFVPTWYKTPTDGPLLINARAETVAEKPAFRAAVRARRCLVACDGFFEWKREKGQTPLPWFVTRADGAPLVMAGIWQDWERDGERVTGCAIVTCAANAAMARIHDRIPVILDPADWPLWLGEAGHGAATLMHAPAEEALTFVRVGTAVNSNRASGPELIEPVEQGRLV
ncbi:MAG: SOS response-associated peptidase [Limimaricola sp.]|uniref:SOS response-associated peptidase n=1 Tax=Limimaricola sp. TaxID=2211665 RepID=UPI001D7FF5BA|nr:SOS response-associated peptidase [Limimaricola sp.]MBI1415747.1 SOS response-associated peptidase [Limimaricola sp.]